MSLSTGSHAAPEAEEHRDADTGARDRTSSRLDLLVPALWYVAVALLYFWPMLAGRSSSAVPGLQAQLWPWRGTVDRDAPAALQVDGAASSYPWSVSYHEAIRDRALPAWDWHSFSGGYDLLSDGVSGALYPIHWMTWAVFDPARAHDAYMLIHFLAAGLLMHCLLRHWGTGTGPALVGGTLWMLAPFNAGWMQAEMLTPVSLTVPLAFWAVSSAMRHGTPRSVLGASAALTLALVAGNFVVFLVVVWVVGLYGVVLVLTALARGPWRLARRKAETLATVVVGAVCLSAYSLVPTLLNLLSLGRRPATLDEVLPPQAPFRLVLDGLWHRPTADLPIALFDLGWTGRLALVLAVVGLLHRSGARVLALVLAGFFALLPTTPALVHLGWYVIPPLRAVSGFGRLDFFVSFGLATLAALGASVLVSALVRWVPERARFRAPLGSVVAGMALAGIGVAELLPFAVAVNPSWTDVESDPFFPVTAAHRAIRASQPAGWPGLTLPLTPAAPEGSTEPLRYALWAATSHIDGVDSVGGYDSAVSRRATALTRVMEGTPPIEAVKPFSTAYLPAFSSEWARLDLAQRLGVTHVYAPPGVDLADSVYAGLQPATTVVHRGRDGTVWALDDPMRGPRLVASPVFVASPAAALQRFTAPDHDARSSVVLEGKEPERAAATAGAGAGPSGGVVRSARSHDSASVRVDAESASWLVMPIGYAPGWSAEVDDRPVALRPADYAFSAVRVPAGQHEVTFTYRPRGYLLGVALTSTTALSGLLLLLLPAARQLQARRRIRSAT